VQNARNQNSASFLAIKHDMVPALHSAQAATDIVTTSAQRGIVSQHLAKRFQRVDVSERLIFAPSTFAIGDDPEQIDFDAT